MTCQGFGTNIGISASACRLFNYRFLDSWVGVFFNCQTLETGNVSQKPAVPISLYDSRKASDRNKSHASHHAAPTPPTFAGTTEATNSCSVGRCSKSLLGASSRQLLRRLVSVATVKIHVYCADPVFVVLAGCP